MANSEHPLARHSGGGTQAAGLAVTLLTLVLVQVGFGGGDIVHIINGALVDTDAVTLVSILYNIKVMTDYKSDSYFRGIGVEWMLP